MLAWLYDVVLDENCIRFVLFRFLTVYRLKPDNLESVVEIDALSPGALNAYNFKNRFLARSFQLSLRRGWFARRLLITPKDPDTFFQWLRIHGVNGSL